MSSPAWTARPVRNAPTRCGTSLTGRRQLITYHFMFDPAWEEGCNGCSVLGDHMPPLDHLNGRDTTWVAVSRAPLAKLQAYKKKMGWHFPWVSSYGSDFNYDFHVTLDRSVRPVQYNYRTDEELQARGLDFHAAGEQPGASFFILGGGGKDGWGEEGKVYHTYSSYSRANEVHVPTFTWLDMTKLGRQIPDMFPRRHEYTAEDLKGTA